MEIKYINRATGQIEIEHPPAEGLLNFLYENPVGETLVLPIARQKFISQMYGRQMDSPRSRKRIGPFVEEYEIDMSEAEKSMDEFSSFNDFFYRKLKPNAREIQSGLVSPGDGKLLAFDKVKDVNEFYIKGKPFTLESFLVDPDRVEKYRESSMYILRLAPNDYHRYHFPYAGRASASQEIKGSYYSVSPISLEQHFTKVFCDNKKSICELSSDSRGDMLIIPVGATMVGSINETYEADTEVEKGQEMGYFAFGGSTIVVLFDPLYFTIATDILQNTRKGLETFVRMGDSIGEER